MPDEGGVGGFTGGARPGDGTLSPSRLQRGADGRFFVHYRAPITGIFVIDLYYREPLALREYTTVISGRTQNGSDVSKRAGKNDLELLVRPMQSAFAATSAAILPGDPDGCLRLELVADERLRAEYVPVGSAPFEVRAVKRETKTPTDIDEVRRLGKIAFIKSITESAAALAVQPQILGSSSDNDTLRQPTVRAPPSSSAAKGSTESGHLAREPQLLTSRPLGALSGNRRPGEVGKAHGAPTRVPGRISSLFSKVDGAAEPEAIEDIIIEDEAARSASLSPSSSGKNAVVDRRAQAKCWPASPAVQNGASTGLSLRNYCSNPDSDVSTILSSYYRTKTTSFDAHNMWTNMDHEQQQQHPE